MKILISFLTVIILTSGCGILEPEESLPTLSFSPKKLSIDEWTTDRITLQVVDFEEAIFGLSCILSYDPDHLSFSDTSYYAVGDFFGSDAVVFVKAKTGQIHLSLVLKQGQEPVTGSGSLLELSLRGRTAGTCELEIIPSELHFYDEVGDTLSISDLEIKSATITVKEWV